MNKEKRNLGVLYILAFVLYQTVEKSNSALKESFNGD